MIKIVHGSVQEVAGQIVKLDRVLLFHDEPEARRAGNVSRSMWELIHQLWDIISPISLVKESAAIHLAFQSHGLARLLEIPSFVSPLGHHGIEKVLIVISLDFLLQPEHHTPESQSLQEVTPLFPMIATNLKAQDIGVVGLQLTPQQLASEGPAERPHRAVRIHLARRVNLGQHIVREHSEDADLAQAWRRSLFVDVR